MHTHPYPSTGRGDRSKHCLTALRKTLRSLTTNRVDGRSAVALAMRRWLVTARTGWPPPGQTSSRDGLTSLSGP
jgi:hypothetical protein